MTCFSSVPIGDVLHPILFLLEILDTAALDNRIDQALPHSHSHCLDLRLQDLAEVCLSMYGKSIGGKKFRQGCSSCFL
jgi:hypothetical protein